jgi:hypothetical protein
MRVVNVSSFWRPHPLIFVVQVDRRAAMEEESRQQDKKRHKKEKKGKSSKDKKKKQKKGKKSAGKRRQAPSSSSSPSSKSTCNSSDESDSSSSTSSSVTTDIKKAGKEVDKLTRVVLCNVRVLVLLSVHLFSCHAHNLCHLRIMLPKVSRSHCTHFAWRRYRWLITLTTRRRTFTDGDA